MTELAIKDINTYGAVPRDANVEVDNDPVATEVIRHGLDAAADYMRIALQRAAFSPIIYDARDFACALYDPQARLLAQGKVLPIFLGTLSYCVEACVEAVGGIETIKPGDLIVSNQPFQIGGHAHDIVVVQPAFIEGELMGFAVVRAHHLDVGAKALFCTDTIDMYQEGTFFPGVRLYREGERNEDLWRTMLANTRLPEALAGDLSAEIGGVRLGLAAFERVVMRYGRERFKRLVEGVFDHGEELARRALIDIPDGTYTATHMLDGNGVMEEPLEFEVKVEVDGSDVTVDLVNAPEQQQGPINSPIAATMSAMRCALMTIAGGTETANEGFFRPLTVRAARRTIFDPTPPAPTYLYAWPSIQAIEVVHRALHESVPTIPAASAGDINALLWWGYTEDGEFWGDGADHGSGQGASVQGDGGPPLMHISASGTRTSSAEVIESRTPFVIETHALRVDSGGAGKYRGGLGELWRFRATRDSYCAIPGERTKTRPWGLVGGDDAESTRYRLILADGEVSEYSKASNLLLPADSVLEAATGGGGGYGPPAERDVDAIEADLTAGYITEDAARRDYPHAF